MLKGILRFILYSLSIVFIAWVIPGISVANFLSAMFACIIIAIINTVLKPFIQAITLPVNLITLGLFTLVINALLFMLAGWITPGLEVNGFLNALLGSIILSLLSLLISKIE